jgi:hypothetical protein
MAIHPQYRKWLVKMIQMEVTSVESNYELVPSSVMFKLSSMSIGFMYGQMPLKQIIRSPSA